MTDDVHALVAETQMRRLTRSDPMRSSIPGGAGLGGISPNWRVVGRWADVVDRSTVDVFGGVEGFTTYFPRSEGLIG